VKTGTTLVKSPSWPTLSREYSWTERVDHTQHLEHMHTNVRGVWKHAPRRVLKNPSCKIASESNQLSTTCIMLMSVVASEKPCNLIIQFDHVQLDHVFIASFNVQVYSKYRSFKWNSNESDSHSLSDNSKMLLIESIFVRKSSRIRSRLMVVYWHRFYTRSPVK